MWSIVRRVFGKKRGKAQSSSTPASIPGRDLLEQLKHQFEGSDDVKLRSFQLGDRGPKGAVIYADGMVDEERIERTTMRPLVRWGEKEHHDTTRRPTNLHVLKTQVLTGSEMEEVPDLQEAVDTVLDGDSLVVLEGDRKALKVANRGGKARGVEDPVLELTVRGPRDSFTETLFLNTALVRRRVRDPSLRVTVNKIGRRTRTGVALLYIEELTPPGLIDEIKRRLDGIDIDGILDTGYIEHLIEDEWYSPFPQHLKTERPDRAVASLLEGRALLIADTTPFALMMPATLDSFFHSPEDSYDRFLPVNLLRMVRFFASILSVIGPGLYVALVAYHPGILPTELALRINAAREGVAFPVLVEALLMQFFLELIKEASLRLPGPIGQTFGIVGGLILGDIGVRAGLVSEAMVVTVAITAISSFASIDREMGTVLRLLGLPVMLSAAVLGLYGLMMASLFIAIHVAVLRSYGVPYFAPYPYYRWSDMKDTIIKGPLRSFHRRPSYLGPPESRRLRDDRSEPGSGKGG